MGYPVLGRHRKETRASHPQQGGNMATPQRGWNQAGNSQTLDAAYAAVRAGNTNQALGIAASVIHQQPANERAWLLLASLIDDRDKKRQCLNRVLAINPNNTEAKVELLLLDTPLAAAPAQPPAPPVVMSQPAPAQPSAVADARGKPKEPLSNKVFWLAVAGVVACMLVFGVGALLVISNRASLGIALPQFADTPVSPPISVATDTPAPTATRRPPPPTATRVIAPSPPDKTTYLSGLQQTLSRFIDILDVLGSLLNSSDISSPAWRSDMMANTAAMRDVYAELLRMVPPTEFAPFHQQLLDGMWDCNEATLHLDAAFDNLSTPELQKANELLTSCADKMRVALQTFPTVATPPLTSSPTKLPSTTSPHDSSTRLVTFRVFDTIPSEDDKSWFDTADVSFTNDTGGTYVLIVRPPWELGPFPFREGDYVYLSASHTQRRFVTCQIDVDGLLWQESSGSYANCRGILP
jgi:hypothetical protein